MFSEHTLAKLVLTEDGYCSHRTKSDFFGVDYLALISISLELEREEKKKFDKLSEILFFVLCATKRSDDDFHE